MTSKVPMTVLPMTVLPMTVQHPLMSQAAQSGHGRSAQGNAADGTSPLNTNPWGLTRQQLLLLPDQALARVVADHMGGPSASRPLSRRYAEASRQLKARAGSVVLPIGQLRVGLARHRALLFKTLADACELPCRMLRGPNMGGTPIPGPALLSTVACFVPVSQVPARLTCRVKSEKALQFCSSAAPCLSYRFWLASPAQSRIRRQ